MQGSVANSVNFDSLSAEEAMSRFCAGATPGLDVETVLRLLVADFSTAPLANGKRMRDLMKMDFDAFRVASVSVLRDPGDIRGCRYLVTLLWTHDQLIPILSDVTLPKELCLTVAQTAAKVDAQLHIRIIRFLVTGMLEGHEVEEAAASRLLETLSIIADSVSIGPFLRQMLVHPSSRIRSKVTLLVGRGHSGLRAIEKLIHDEDARVRANAVEALWVSRDPLAIELLRIALDDPNNRVVGNAILGLYMTGETTAFPAIMKMAGHQNAVFRATSAWVMGRSGDPRFLPLLGRLLAESQGQLRKTVFNALNGVKKAVSARSTSAATASILTFEETSSGHCRIALTLKANDVAELPPVRPTDIAIHLDGEFVTEYATAEQRSDQLAIGFILPRRPNSQDPLRAAVTSGMHACLKVKRRAEQWSVLRYSDSVASESRAPMQLFGQNMEISRSDVSSNAPSAFSSNSATLQNAIESNGLRFDSQMGPYQAMFSVMTGVLPPRGARHLVAILSDCAPIDVENIEELTRVCRASGFSLNVISDRHDPELASLCSSTLGLFRLVSGPSEIPDVLAILYYSMRRRYLIEFSIPPESKSARVTVQVNAASFTTEASIERTRTHANQ